MMRVGALARGLMLQGERQMEVVLMMKSMCCVCVCARMCVRVCCVCAYICGCVCVRVCVLRLLLHCFSYCVGSNSLTVILNDTGKPTKEVLQRIVNLLPDKLTVHIIL